MTYSTLHCTHTHIYICIYIKDFLLNVSKYYFTLKYCHVFFIILSERSFQIEVCDTTGDHFCDGMAVCICHCHCCVYIFMP